MYLVVCTASTHCLINHHSHFLNVAITLSHPEFSDKVCTEETLTRISLTTDH